MPRALRAQTLNAKPCKPCWSRKWAWQAGGRDVVGAEGHDALGVTRGRVGCGRMVTYGDVWSAHEVCSKGVWCGGRPHRAAGAGVGAVRDVPVVPQDREQEE